MRPAVFAILFVPKLFLFVRPPALTRAPRKVIGHHLFCFGTFASQGDGLPSKGSTIATSRSTKSLQG
jgi:hypothetical protein